LKPIENCKNVWKINGRQHRFSSVFFSSIDFNRLYPALKLLEQLETKHLVLVKEHRWSELIQRNIAKFRDQIRHESHNELKNFLENVATYADKIGKSAFAQVESRVFFVRCRDIYFRVYRLQHVSISIVVIIF